MVELGEVETGGVEDGSEEDDSQTDDEGDDGIPAASWWIRRVHGCDDISDMEQTYFLHLLVNDPARVIPPGKSLLSMVAHANVSPPPLVDRVKQVAHRAFWDEAEQVLRDPLPSVQLPRLGRLYRDLFDALSPLFPPNHPVLLALSAPVPPTSSPLRSTLSFLREILSALRQRCAPLRDPTIDQLLLSHPPIDNPSLAHFVIDTIKSVIALAEDMKSDLSSFVLGSMSESQLHTFLANDLKKRERDLVLDAWAGLLPVQDAWNAWIPTHNQPWILSLLRALASDTPVACQPPPNPPHPNQLPPQLLFSTPQLLYIQNYLQAIIIAAALRSLSRLPPPATPGIDHDFMNRVWSLLKAEIDADSNIPHDDHTKLINLADEVVRARQIVLAPAPLHPDEDLRLRAAVERTIRSHDPVFLLLKKRLFTALENHHLSQDTPPRSSIPLRMQTGRAFQEPSSPPPILLPPVPSIPAFEEPVLQHAIADVSQKIINCVTWTNTVWDDL